MDQQQTELDTLIDQAYELFLELAADNLDEATIARFNREFPDHGGLGDCEPEADWEDEIQAEVRPEEWLEVRVGLLNADDEFDYLFARMLINRDPESQECHILWQPE
ncbi:HI1450 family dsDNA-mimic protein [Tolumonas lignilytica]|jgi:Uncharacterized protein conserved in bacteria|uniref:HI1450 family dsDNA-mimic protein n=1 Tax=Tolumonas lignilytica TaxID=1283284 RepID=UPI000464C0E6|nr:HI1450 family dsDNA-mimic protein [Tolumonas lignilytica]